METRTFKNQDASVVVPDYVDFAVLETPEENKLPNGVLRLTGVFGVALNSWEYHSNHGEDTDVRLVYVRGDGSTVDVTPNK